MYSLIRIGNTILDLDRVESAEVSTAGDLIVRLKSDRVLLISNVTLDELENRINAARRLARSAGAGAILSTD